MTGDELCGQIQAEIAHHPGWQPDPVFYQIYLRAVIQKARENGGELRLKADTLMGPEGVLLAVDGDDIILRIIENPLGLHGSIRSSGGGMDA